jgi:seryl-tRNA synthetase
MAREGEHRPKLPGHHWFENGQSAYSGEALRLFQRLDAEFLSWAGEFSAREYGFPTHLPAADLQKIDYLRSFQHLATFPASLDKDADKLRRFATAPLDESGAVRLTDLAPVRDVLTPAACYHFYRLFQGTQLDATRYLTTRNTCFRREDAYTPLERQSAFTMREIVCIGREDDVRRFLARATELTTAFCARIDLPVVVAGATDPFFDPSSNPKHFAQRMAPLKTELVFEEHLAIASVNYHRTYMGEAFDMTTDDGELAHSGCIGFGIDRWMYAFARRFGDEAKWPIP